MHDRAGDREQQGDRERSQPGPGGGFSCPDYDPDPGGRRCRAYLDGGACARPDQFMCTEWLKRNDNQDEQGEVSPSPSEGDSLRSLAPVGVAGEAPPGGALGCAALSSFKHLGAEVLVRFEGGSLWIVPEYSGADRPELRVDHAATLAALCSVFPGAGVLAFQHRAAARQDPPAGASGPEPWE